MSAPLLVSVAAPFAPPSHFFAPAGASLAEIAEGAFARGLLDRAFAPRLSILIDGDAAPRALWARARPRPGVAILLQGAPGSPGIIAGAVWEYAKMSLVAFGVQKVISAFTPTPKTNPGEELFSIDAARNQLAPWQSWPCLLGQHRIFLPLASRHFTRAVGEKVFLHLLLALGPGAHALDGDTIEIGDRPLSSFPGAQWQARLKPGDPWPSLFPPRQPDEQDGPGVIEQGDGWVEMVTDSDECDSLEVEITWIEGLVRHRSQGGYAPAQAAYRIRYRETGSGTWLAFATGSPSDTGTLYDQTVTRRKPFRETRVRAVDRGRYDVAVQRVTADSDSGAYKNAFAWSKLRSFTDEPPVLDDNLAVLAIQLEAGPQVDRIVDQINCKPVRLAPVWDDGEEEWGEGEATSNPAALTRWIAMGPAAALPYAEDEIDQEAFGAWYELCVANDWRCDHNIAAGAGMSFAEALAFAARCGRASLSIVDGKLTPVLDVAQAAPRQLFTPRNSWGLAMRRRLPAPVHAYRMEFDNAAKNYVRDELIVYFPGYDADSAELIETRFVPGKTRAVEVNREGRRAVAETILRSEEYSFSADWEHLALRRGDRFALAHWAVAVGRVSGRVAALETEAGDTVAVILDEDVAQTVGESYALEWRRVNDDGFSVHVELVETIPGVSRRVEFASAVATAAGPQVGDLATFGDAAKTTVDLVAAEITRAPHLEAQIQAAAYVEALWEDDDAPEPEWSSPVSGDAFPAPPAPAWLGVAATADGIFAEFDFPTHRAAEVAQIESWWRNKDDDDARFELWEVLDGSARAAAFPAGEFGATYELLIVAINADSRRTQSEVFEIASGAFGILLDGRLTNPAHIVAADADGTVASFDGAGGVFEVWAGGVDLTGDGPAYSVESETGVDVSINAESGVYTVSSMSAPQGWAVLRAALDGAAPIDRIYSIAKGVAGADGEDGGAGQNATAYWLARSAAAIRRAPSGDYTPPTITFVLFAATGAGAPALYAGRFIIATSTNGVDFTNQYTSSGDESSKEYTIPAGIVAVRVRGYLAGGTTTLIDEEIVPVVFDGEEGDPGDDGLSGITFAFSNHAHTVPASSAGVVSSYAGSGGTLKVFEGSTALTFHTTLAAGRFVVGTPTVAPTSAITVGARSGSGTDTCTVANHSAMSNSEPTATITYPVTARRANGSDVAFDVVQTITKGIAGTNGTNGTNGQNATSYWLEASAGALVRSQAGAYTPPTFTVQSFSQTGTGAPGAYAGRFIIAESTNGTDYTNVYTSGSNESNKTHTPGSGLKAIRVRMYQAGGTSVLLGERIIPVAVEPPGATAGMSLSLNIYSDSKFDGNVTPEQLTSASVTATASGGVAPYTYKWSQLPGHSGTANSPNSATTTFGSTPPTNDTATATFRCVATDNDGITATAIFEFTVTHSV